MKAIYEKTYYEELIDILEDAFLADRIINRIEMPISEYKHITKQYTNTQFISSIRRKVYIKDISLTCIPDDVTTAHISYHCMRSLYDQSAQLKFVKVVIL
jgi:hypothetical protein